MPKMVWTTFVARHPGGHLVVATVPIEAGQDIGTRHLRDLHAWFSKLVARLTPVGDYAVTIVRDAGLPEIHAAFAERSDADRLAATVKARPPDGVNPGRHPEWGSRRLFVLDEPTGAAIAASLATESGLDGR
jgi:hypothetical protein